MKTANLDPEHQLDVTRGRKNPNQAAGSGGTYRDGTSTIGPIWDLTVIGGTFTDNGDGTAVLTIDGSGTGDADTLLGVPIQAWSGPLSQPPTESELEAILGPPSSSAGLHFNVADTTGTTYHYLVSSDGAQYWTVPFQRATGLGTTTALTTAPAGGWTQIINDRAAYYNGKTYFAYVRGDNGDVAIRSYTHSTGTVSAEFVLHAALGVDTHDAPVLLVRDSDKKIVVAYSHHTGAAMYVRISTNAEDISAFGAEANIDSSLGGTAYTYPNLVQLLGEGSDPIYLFYRDEQSAGTIIAWAYSRSTDGGATWSAGTVFVRGVGSKVPYLTFESDSNVRVDIAMSDGHPVADAPTDVYHMYFTGGWFFKTDDTAIAGSLPLFPTAATLVYDATTESGWPVNVANTGGVLAFSYQVLLTGGTDCSNRYARWSGGAWVLTTIVSAGGVVEGAVGFMASIDRNAPNLVYAPVKVSGQWEIQEWITADGGASFTLNRSITTGSSVDNFHPVPVKNAASTLKIIWLAGTYTTYLSNSLGIKGLVA